LDRHPIEKEQTEHLLALLAKTGSTSTHILLYGDPGTGKTSYAQGLIRALKQTGYQIVRDEENKASNRRAAIVACLNLTRQEPRPIIIVDEADTFLFSRDRAVRSWEISFTNEFLTQMERYRGILICTTNRMTDLDQASIRRFNHKIRFDYLTPEVVGF
jgi:transitional endoplasmic reticulum ATPase